MAVLATWHSPLPHVHLYARVFGCASRHRAPALDFPRAEETFSPISRAKPASRRLLGRDFFPWRDHPVPSPRPPPPQQIPTLSIAKAASSPANPDALLAKATRSQVRSSSMIFFSLVMANQFPASSMIFFSLAAVGSHGGALDQVVNLGFICSSGGGLDM